ncbi:MAG: DoxX family protein [Patescibacteria group bacterium]
MFELFQLADLQDTALFVARIALAAVFLFHGDQKLHYWKMHHNAKLSIAWLALWRTLAVVEILSGIGMLIGAFTKIAALCIMAVMLGALYFKIKVWKKGFSGDNGWEFDLVLFTSAFLIFIMGAGIYSIDWNVFGI